MVGARKRKGLQEKAAASGFKILNTRVIKERVAEESLAAPEKDTVKAKKDTKETKKAPGRRALQMQKVPGRRALMRKSR